MPPCRVIFTGGMCTQFTAEDLEFMLSKQGGAVRTAPVEIHTPRAPLVQLPPYYRPHGECLLTNTQAAPPYRYETVVSDMVQHDGTTIPALAVVTFASEEDAMEALDRLDGAAKNPADARSDNPAIRERVVRVDANFDGGFGTERLVLARLMYGRAESAK